MAFAIPPALAEEAGAQYLAGRTIGDLVQAQQKAIVEALAEAQRPVRTIDLPQPRRTDALARS